MAQLACIQASRRHNSQLLGTPRVVNGVVLASHPLIDCVTCSQLCGGLGCVRTWHRLRSDNEDVFAADSQLVMGAPACWYAGVVLMS